MKSIVTIARNTFREAIRDRILYMFLAFAILLILGSKFISMMTIGDPVKIIKDIGLFSIQIFGMLIAVMMSVIMVSREFEQRTIYTILAKPVNRLHYLLGKYFGLVAIILAMIIMMVVALILIIFVFSLEFDVSMIFGAFTTLLEMMVLCAFAIMFSTVTKPILGSVLTLTSFLVGHLTSALLLLKDRMEDAISQFIIPIIYYISPNLEVFNFKTEIVHNLAIPWSAVVWALLYSIFYSALVLVISWVLFINKDIE